MITGINEILSTLKIYIKNISSALYSQTKGQKNITEEILDNCKDMFFLVERLEYELNNPSDKKSEKTVCPCNGANLLCIDGDIYYCDIPPADMGGECKKCDYFGVTALEALAKEINKLQKELQAHIKGL